MPTREEMIEAVRANKSFRYVQVSVPGAIHYWKGKSSVYLYPKIKLCKDGRYRADRIEDHELLSDMGIPYSWNEQEMELVEFILSEFGFGLIDVTDQAFESHSKPLG